MYNVKELHQHYNLGVPKKKISCKSTVKDFLHKV